LPRNPNGKIDRKSLVEELRDAVSRNGYRHRKGMRDG
jgi:hypothetical protein